MRIVIVEDEALIREGLARTVGKLSPRYEVVGTAADGEAGYELIRRMRPDLVIMDIRMPKMDGLDMMGKLRQEQIKCKVVVLSAYSDFSYAQRAIQLGIVSYLLKPVNLAELKNVLEKVGEMCRNEEQKDKMFSRDSIFWGILNGKLSVNTELDNLVRDKYGFSVKDSAGLFMLWLGKGYESRKWQACQLLESVSEHDARFDSYVMEMDDKNALFMIVYNQSGGSVREHFQRSVVPMLVDRLGNPVLGVWRDLGNIVDIRPAALEFEKDLRWGLVLDAKTMICKGEIEKISTPPLRYPLGIEDEAGLAVRCKGVGKIARCYEKIQEYCKRHTNEPAELRKSLIRFNWAVIHADGRLFSESVSEFQQISQCISTAVTWSEIRESMERFFAVVRNEMTDDKDKNAEKEVSGMVLKAQKLIEKYYDQGVTLEEIAAKLFVSGEYLSAQFRKETGVTFTGTVRRYRIEKVKRLLLETQLKLSQIADLSGYSDPKYMSRVFKEETGMLPSEYRKSVH